MDKLTKSSPLESKKFVAAMLWNFMWLCLIAYGIYSSLADSVLLSMVWVSGATQITYIGGQAALDAFVRKAFLLNGHGDKLPPPHEERVGEP